MKQKSYFEEGKLSENVIVQGERSNIPYKNNIIWFKNHNVKSGANPYNQYMGVFPPGFQSVNYSICF